MPSDFGEKIIAILMLVVGLTMAGYALGSMVLGRFGGCVEQETRGDCAHPRHRLVLEPGVKVCRCQGAP